jgi:hypothetical protein
MAMISTANDAEFISNKHIKETEKNHTHTSTTTKQIPKNRVCRFLLARIRIWIVFL